MTPIQKITRTVDLSMLPVGQLEGHKHQHIICKSTDVPTHNSYQGLALFHGSASIHEVVHFILDDQIKGKVSK